MYVHVHALMGALGETGPFYAPDALPSASIWPEADAWDMRSAALDPLPYVLWKLPAAVLLFPKPEYCAAAAPVPYPDMDA